MRDKETFDDCVLTAETLYCCGCDLRRDFHCCLYVVYFITIPSVEVFVKECKQVIVKHSVTFSFTAVLRLSVSVL